MTDEPRTTYTTSSGEVFDVGGGSRVLAGTDENSWEWSVSGSSSPTLEPRDLSATLAYADERDKAECERLLAIAFSDLQALRPGILTVGDWSLECYILKGDPIAVEDGWAGWKVTLHAPLPLWSRKRALAVRPREAGRAPGHDLPLDFPFDYGEEIDESNVVDGGPAGCLALIRFYGPFSSPWASIAGNRYGVEAEVPSGAILTIDPLRKGSMEHDSIVLKGEYGDVRDVFDKRLRGASGSGSYVFEPVPAGEHEVLSPKGLSFDVVTIERRAAIPWT